MGSATVNCIAATVVNLALGIYVLSRAPRELVNRVFFVITMAISVTAVGEVVMRAAGSEEVILLGARIGAVGWCFFGALFVHFALAFTRDEKLLGRWQTYVALYVPSAVLLLLAWSTSLVYEGFRDTAGGFYEIEGPLKYPSGVFIVAMFVIGIIIVWRFWRRTPSKNDREDAFLVLVSAAFMIVVGVITDVILIFIYKQNPPVNMFTASMVMAIAIAYAVTRRGFLSSLTAGMGRTIISIMTDPVLVLDSTGAIDMANQAMVRLSGQGEKDLKQSALSDLLLCENEGSDIYRKINAGEVSRCGGECVTWTGEMVPVTVSSGALSSKSGRQLGSIVVVHDMRDTLERIEAEKQVKIATVEADAERRHSQALRDILDIACHELRTPATVFKGYSAILRNSLESLDECMVEVALSSMDSAADRVARLADSLIDASALESGPLELSIEETRPSSVVRGSVGTMQKQYPDHEFTVIMEDGERPIRVDVDMIESVFIVLLDNAVKFSPAGTEVRVWFDQDGSKTVFHIEDEGQGVPEEHRDKIFDRFYQVEEAAHHTLPGLGLGLYIAKRIVEAHGGWIEAKHATAGEGADFCFSIPYSGDKR